MESSSTLYRVIQDISRIININMYSDTRLKLIISMYAHKRGMTPEQAVDEMCQELKRVIL